MRWVLDTGALVALERNDRAMWRRYKAALLAGGGLITHAGVVGQVWRAGGPRQALLARALGGVEVRGLDAELGRSAGALLARSRTSDVIDAAVVLLTEDGDRIVTSDPEDLRVLAAAHGRDIELVEA